MPHESTITKKKVYKYHKYFKTRKIQEYDSNYYITINQSKLINLDIYDIIIIGILVLVLTM